MAHQRPVSMASSSKATWARYGNLLLHISEGKVRGSTSAYSWVLDRASFLPAHLIGCHWGIILNPFLHDLHHSSEDLGVWGLLNEGGQDGLDEVLTHLHAHHRQTSLYEIQAQHHQLACSSCAEEQTHLSDPTDVVKGAVVCRKHSQMLSPATGMLGLDATPRLMAAPPRTVPSSSPSHKKGGMTRAVGPMQGTQPLHSPSEATWHLGPGETLNSHGKHNTLLPPNSPVSRSLGSALEPNIILLKQQL